MNTIDLNTICTGTKKIAQVGIISQRRIYFFFHNLGRSNRTYVSTGIHIPNSNIGTTHEINKITGSFRVACIFRNHPTIIPNVATFLWDYIIKAHSHCLSLFNSPHGVTTPRHINPGLIFCHHLFSEISLPAGNIRLHRFEVFLYYCHRFRRIIVHQLFNRYFSFFQLFSMRVDDSCSVCITISIFHQNFTGIFLIPKTLPSVYLLLGNKSLVIKNPCCTPHVTNCILVGRTSRLAKFSYLFTDIWRNIVHIIGRMSKNSINGQQQIFP